jgi:ribosome-associated toxin RatA of RatAB toxin-antitoxin module
MPSYRGRQQAELDASPQTCFDALTDYERLPEWQRAVKSARIVEHADDHDVVEYEVDAKLTTLRYTLKQCYDAPRLIDSDYVDGAFRSMSGRWTFDERPGGRTLAAVEIAVDPGRWVPGPIKHAIEDALLKRALQDLRSRVEGADGG